MRCRFVDPGSEIACTQDVDDDEVNEYCWRHTPDNPSGWEPAQWDDMRSQDEWAFANDIDPNNMREES